MITKKRNQKHKQVSEPQQQVVRPSPAYRGRWLLILLAFGVCAATWGFCEFIVWNRLPSELVGKWVVVKGPPEYEDAIFDFYRNGTMEARINVKGNVGIIKASVHVEGDKIYATTRQPETGQEKTQVQVIHSLTAAELVVEDEFGKVTYMERVK
jgi:uncharacterized protein (TIGR03066 family)